MSKDPMELIRHIHDECTYLLSLTDRGLTEAKFLNDETLKRATVRSLEIIGEATKKIPDDFRAIWPDINWKNMAGMRDRLIHDYMGVNYSIVWDVIKNKIPDLDVQIKKILRNAGKSR